MDRPVEEPTVPDAAARFAAALLRHVEGNRLRAAFDRCNRRPHLESYDRTSLTRWLRGAVPGREAFVAALAEELGDPEIHAVWASLQADRSQEDVRGLVSRFRSLPPEHKANAFRQLSQAMTSSALVRSNFTMRIDLHDSADPELYRLRVEVGWTGHLPQAATIVFVTEEEGLADAYASESCIFRDVIQLDKRRLDDVLADSTLYQQGLSFTPLGAQARTPAPLVGQAMGDGRYQFSNDEIGRARIRVRATYPFPRAAPIYPIVFNRYQIAGTFTISLVMHSATASGLGCYSYLGREPRWEVSKFVEELTVESGNDETLLDPGTGVVFYWSEFSG